MRELVETRARAAREAARTLALADARVKSDALLAMARGARGEGAGDPRGEPRGSRAGPRARGIRGPSSTASRSPTRGSRPWRPACARSPLLPDPVGEIVRGWRRPNGIEIARVRVPLGVVGFIYESRPNVTADAAALCVKSGNAVRAPRRQGSHRVERGHRRDPRPGAREGRAPAGGDRVRRRRRPRGRRGPDHARPVRRPGGAARRRGVRALRGRARHDPGAQARQGRLPRLRGRRRRPPDGGRHRGEREGAAPGRLQRHGDAPRPRRRRRRVPARRRRPLPRGRRRAPRLPADVRAGPGRPARDGGRLGHGVPRPHPLRPGRDELRGRRRSTSGATARGWPRPS